MAKSRKNHKSQGHYPGKLRIIGGQWRGRTLAVAEGEGLRPTPNRVRETLFNWLQPRLPGARCLDLFAGSGALCLESLSRGAAKVVMVERATDAVKQLRENLGILQAGNAELIQTDALTYLKVARQPFDIIFVDPPFASDLIGPCLEAIDRQAWLCDGGLVYIEAPSKLDALPLPHHWTVFRSKTSGQVGYHLVRPEPEET
ncbi:MAG: 16S rRNA (guanine(966)-N(2))-methyltransferase RsmD [Gammaproteobacteria bacterium]|nr:MAG: 16S rRNA (guanine(966)-N(2))-methyltransferase RsmD [Gammaproteobacteria bacterium]